jgi:hypothetical protein
MGDMFGYVQRQLYRLPGAPPVNPIQPGEV